MSDGTLWAAFYQFAEELWRGRNRVVCDPALAGAIRSPGDDRIAQLVGDLLPETDALVWLASDEDLAGDLGERASLCGMVELPEVLADEPWDTALLDFSAVLQQSDSPDRGLAAEVLEALSSEVQQPGRTVLVWVSAGEIRPGPTSLDLEQLSRILDERFGDTEVPWSIHGVYRPAMAAFVEFAADDAGEQDDVPLTFDNTLGSEPSFSHYLVVIGEGASEGMNLVELPHGDDASTGTRVALDSQSSSRGDAALRTELAEARRQADLAAIAKQSLLEKLEQLEAKNAALEEALADMRHRLAKAVAVTPEQGDGGEDSSRERLDAAMAREQSLRWRLTQYERELEGLRRRPVDALEAELAQLRAALQECRNQLEPRSPESASIDNRSSDRGPEISDGKPRGESLPSGKRQKQASLAVSALVRRVERGGIGALQLRRELVALQCLLRPTT